MSKVSQCESSLDFRPLKVWPRSFPCVAFEGQLLTGFGSPADHAATDFSSATDDFAQIFLDCHPQLTLPELARFYFASLKAEFAPALAAFAQIANQLGFRDCESLRETLLNLVQTPFEFQNWAATRGIAPRELSVLKSVEDFSVVENIFLAIASLNLTRSQGAQALEWALELFLMGRSLEEILPIRSSENSVELVQVWMRHLEALRKPQTLARERKAQEIVESLPWPAYTHARWQRNGDTGGIEVKFHFTSSEDMKRKLEGLARVQVALEKNSVSKQLGEKCSEKDSGL